jgi:hypothetical protein
LECLNRQEAASEHLVRIPCAQSNTAVRQLFSIENLILRHKPLSAGFVFCSPNIIRISSNICRLRTLSFDDQLIKRTSEFPGNFDYR